MKHAQDDFSLHTVDAALMYGFCRGNLSALTAGECRPLQSLVKRAHATLAKPMVKAVMCALVQPEIDLRTVHLQHVQETHMPPSGFALFDLPRIMLANLSSNAAVETYRHAEEVAYSFQRRIAHLTRNGLVFIPDARSPGNYQFRPGCYSVRNTSKRAYEQLEEAADSVLDELTTHTVNVELWAEAAKAMNPRSLDVTSEPGYVVSPMYTDSLNTPWGAYTSSTPQAGGAGQWNYNQAIRRGLNMTRTH